jgi:Na+/H+ antiporter NhaD/arsenite permease-like protein
MSGKTQTLRAWISRDPVTLAAAAAAALSLFWVRPDAGYLAYLDSKVLICLFSLMLAVEMLREASLFTYLAGSLVNKTVGFRRLAFLLVGLTYFLAMFLTNDVALITLVPLSMIIFRLINESQGLIRIIVLQTLAANVGSALTPIGNPQNLYLFTHYAMRADAFFQTGPPPAWPGRGR